MWRAATLRLRTAKEPALRLRTSTRQTLAPTATVPAMEEWKNWPSPSRPNAGVGLQLRQSSSMENAKTLEDVMKSIQEQMLEDDRRRALENPTPWFSLLHHPSRAAWRSTDQLLGAEGEEERDPKGVSSLSQTQVNLLRHSERTTKQLKRTHKRIMDTHKALAINRERERRLAANVSKPAQAEGRPDGAIEDSEGRHVGSWREKKAISAPSSLCDDPSVALTLSVGLSGSRMGADMDQLLGTAAVKSSKKASKLAKEKGMSSPSGAERPVGYGPEQTLTHIRYRLGPNYSIVKRVLSEVQSLLGGKPPQGSKRKSFRPKRVLDFGSGVGSSSAAALDVFGVRRSACENGAATSGIDWIHSIDASQSMREATEKVLKSILEGAPWDHEEMQTEDRRLLDEELAEYEKIIKEIRGEVNPKRLERQRKKMEKWEHTWTKQTNALTRLTFGESIVDLSSFYSDRIDRDDRPALPWQQQLDEQRRKTMQKKSQATQSGSFDLILCSYTLSELPNVPSSLAAAAVLWEKLAPNGVMVFVEPGTPDGFGVLRSVRSMLLECCPPPEIRQKRKAALKQEEENKGGDNEDDGAVISSNEDSWPEECHVIAPCTHNGTCPMSRHQRDHIKRNTRFGKYASAMPKEEVLETHDDDEDEGGSSSMLDEWESANDEEKEEIKMMLTDGEDMSDEEVVSMLEYLDTVEDDEDDDEEGEDSDSDDDDGELYTIDGEAKEQSKSSRMTTTNVFNTSFCSFVQQFPGGSNRKGEKFTYLVLQKRVTHSQQDSQDIGSDGSNYIISEDQEALDDIDLVGILAKSIHHAQMIKDEERRERVRQHFDRNGSDGSDSEELAYHKNQSNEQLQKALEVEDKYLDSTIDKLGLEMLHGERRKGWGRLIRAPLKRKGHVLLDYCSAGCGGCPRNGLDETSYLPEGTRGRITRQKVSRGWSAKAAPGCYSASRKARWGGLWPDVSERIQHEERKAKKIR